MVPKLMMMQMSFYNLTLGRAPDHWDRVRFVFETYIPVLILAFGLVGNALLCVMMCHLRRRRNPSFYLLFILGITDTITLVVNFVYYYIFPWLIIKPKFMQDITWCRVMGMLGYATTGCSAWVLVTMVTSRFVAIHFPLRKLRIPHMRRTVAIVYVACVLLHVPFLFLMGHDDQIGICLLKDTLIAKIAANYHLILFIIIPFILLVVMNCLVSWDIHQKGERDKKFRVGQSLTEAEQNSKQKQKRNTTAMLVATSWVYLILTIPWYIQDIYWHYLTTLDPYDFSSARYASHSIGYTLTLLSFASNFYIYCLAFKNFRKVLCNMFKRKTNDPSYVQGSQHMTSSV